MPRISLHAMASVAALLLAPLTLAGGLNRIVQQIPRDVDAAIVVADAARLRETPAGAATQRLIAGLFEHGETEDRWRAFADELDLDPERLFDQLFGAEAAFVMRGDDDGWSWVLLSVIPHELDVRMRDRLPSAPRQILGGTPVISIENGRFYMALARKGRHSHILLAPAAARGLFDEMTPTLSKKALEPLIDAPAVHRALRENDADALVRLRVSSGESHHDVVAVATVQGAHLTGPLLLSLCDQMPIVEPWPITEWKALQDGALACVIERRPTASQAKQALKPALLQNMPLAWLVPSPEEEQSLGQRHAILAHARPGGKLDLTAAVELRDLTASAKPADELLRTMITQLSRSLGIGAWDYEFAGLVPEALRRVELSPKGWANFAIIGGAPAELAWTMRETPREDRAWLVCGTAPERVAPLADALAGASAEAEEPRSGAWVSMGVLRPAAILEALAQGGVSLESIEPFGEIRLIGWSIEATTSTELTGRFHVKFVADDEKDEPNP